MSTEKEKEPELMPHVIDGIQEYNNPLPGWWLTMFYGTIAFAIVYQILYPSWFGPGLLHWSEYTQYNNEVQAAEKAEALANKGAGSIDQLVKSPEEIAEGKVIFEQNCAACHGANAQGGIGPNLNKPPYWAYGNGKPSDLEYIVTNGTKKGVSPYSSAAKGGMPTWGPILGKTKIDEAVAYVYSLQHPNGK